MKEKYYDKLLNINTIATQDWNEKNTHNHPYEPTLYLALESLFDNYKLSSTDSLIDFGCGMGRLPFYVNYNFGCNVKGIEINHRYYQEAIYNKIQYIKKNKRGNGEIDFLCNFAQQHEVSKEDNKFYFFNPFSVHVFSKVIDNILKSYEENLRDMDIILYYASDEYIDYLDYKTPFTLSKEIIVKELYHKDSREKFVVYSLSY